MNLTPGANTDGLATKDNTARNAKILLGDNGNTGNVTVSLNRLDTTSVVENGRVRAIVQRIPNNSGGTNQMFTLQSVTALGNSQDYQLVAVHSGKCVDVSGVSTTPGALVHQWTCDPASNLANKRNQIWRLTGKA